MKFKLNDTIIHHINAKHYKIESICGKSYLLTGINVDEILTLDELTILDCFHLFTSSDTITGKKFDNGKIPLELLSPVALIEVGKVLQFGAKKYDPNNWRKGMNWTRLLGASLRHIFAYLSGEDNDSDSGLSHLAHAMCCLMFLIEYKIKVLGDDDRYKYIHKGE